jgi:predicted  nucleic acid-binding Zn-ribbon protein
MKAAAVQQLSLLELASVDAELARLAHRAGKLPEQQALDDRLAEHRDSGDRYAVLGIAIEDVDGQIAKLEEEVDSVRKREDRDRKLLHDGAVDPKHVAELQHELETLERRQAALEDTLLETMQRREELQTEQSEQQARTRELQRAVADAEERHDAAVVELEQAKHRAVSRRGELSVSIDADLFALYEKQRARGGAAAGLLQARRCGACRIEIDRGELSRISAAAEDDVLTCPECGAILVRTRESGL